MAYFPGDKGPYNNNTLQVFHSYLKDNCAGIMRPINSTNFEQSNVEFIEFWLLDTFSDIEGNENELGLSLIHI